MRTPKLGYAKLQIINYKEFIKSTFFEWRSQENGKCDAIDWAATALDENNIVNPKEFLTGQFYTIDYKGNVDPEDVEAYKEDGRLALRYANNGALQADFVKAASLYTKAPPDFVNAYPKTHQRIMARYVDAVSSA